MAVVPSMDIGTGKVSPPSAAVTWGLAHPEDPLAKAAGGCWVVMPLAWQQTCCGKGSKCFCCWTSPSTVFLLQVLRVPQASREGLRWAMLLRGLEQAAELQWRWLQLPVLPGEVAESAISN